MNRTLEALCWLRPFRRFSHSLSSRIADLFRIATKGTGVLPAGQLHPTSSDDCSRRRHSAQGVLDMCIRALDYCPPFDMTFGDTCVLSSLLTRIDPVDELNRALLSSRRFDGMASCQKTSPSPWKGSYGRRPMPYLMKMNQ